ncbi:DNA polymerase kappa isoform X2 [Tripterygium wilfordii]|nr:DNA polymerase kappa isoform X2 [Tripterygium wilfordii]
MQKCETPNGNDPKPWQSYHTVYTNAKAGMDGVDKEKVQRIVYEMSKGSKYFENEERKEAYVKQKIEHMRARIAKLTASDISHFQTVADKRILELEATRDLSRIWLHVDMDAFYAAVETLSNSSLKGKPVAVGSMSMISTANYEARKFGVRAAMPGFIARKLCPQLIFVPTDFKKYTHCSNLTRNVFQNYDSNFMATSLDEAYLDITEVCKERGLGGGEIAEELRSKVYEETGLTCSAGVAPNRLLAKVCSDINKPNGQFVLPNDRLAVLTFISSLPIRKIGGIGKVTESILRDAVGINTCEQMVQKGRLLCALFSRPSADFFLCVGLGLGKTGTPQINFRKSISTERTFSATEDEALLYQKLADISEMLSADMQKEGLCGRTLTLKLKTASFEVRTRAMTLQNNISSAADILKYASKLLKAELPVSLRLIGLRLSQFNEDKLAALSDPTQKALTDFIILGDSSRKNTSDPSSMDSDNNDHRFLNDTEASLSINSHERYPYAYSDPIDCCNHQVDVHNDCTNSDYEGAMDKAHEPLGNTTLEKVNTMGVVGHGLEFYQKKDSQLFKGEDLLPGHVGSSNGDRVNKKVALNNEDTASSNQEEELNWIDDYMCSLCGSELPPSFVEERQEHFDFHLAERLQKEECTPDIRTTILRQRSVQNSHVTSQSKRKKHKSLTKQGGHIPIDMFFVKSNQNF